MEQKTARAVPLRVHEKVSSELKHGDMVQQNSKGPPAPLEAFGLPNDRRAKFVGCALVYCACFLAFVHFGRLIALAADDFDNWEEFYEPVQDPGCFEV